MPGDSSDSSDASDPAQRVATAITVPVAALGARRSMRSLPHHADIFAAGQTIGGHFEIRGVIAAGGMGQVFEAHDHDLNRLVAIKAAWPNLPTADVLTEARAVAAMRHRGLTAIHGVGEHAGRPFVIMERLFGVTLRQHILDRFRRHQTLHIREVVDVALRLTDVLRTVHGSGLAHCDLKPENVMLLPGGRIVVLDFGVVQQEHRVHEADQLQGTPEYVAPEVITSNVAAGRAYLVDLYALGVITYELLAGSPPFRSFIPERLMRQHLDRLPPPIGEARADVPLELGRLVHQLLAKQPDDRPSHADEVIAELRRIHASLDQSIE